MKFVNPSVANKVGKILNCSFSKNCIKTGIKTVNRIHAWDHIKMKGLRVCNSSSMDKYILSEIDKDFVGHSGSSISFTSQHLNHIAKLGEESYILYVQNNLKK